MSLESRRFLFVTGKGGVGKTTVTAALASALARRGKRVLVAMCGAHERLSAILGTPPIGHDIVAVQKRVWATKIEADRAMEEYGQLVLRVKALATVVFDNRYTQAFFRAVPGLHDWAMLGKAWYHTTERLPDGSPRFDVVLFDAPSTGHGLDMLRVPKVILDIVPPGVLRRDAEKAWAMFRDPKESGVVVVSLAEDMPVTETIELCAALRELGLDVQRLVVNQLLDALFSESERVELVAHPAVLDPLHASAGPSSDDAIGRALAAAARRAAREELQARSLERLARELGAPPTTLFPFLLEGAGTPAAVDRLADAFGAVP